MNPVSEAVLEPAAVSRETAPAAPSPTRPFYWSVRRELWENRSIYLAPLGVAAFAVVGMVIHGLPSTLGVTMEMMILHGRAVVRGTQKLAVCVEDAPLDPVDVQGARVTRRDDRVRAWPRRGVLVRHIDPAHA